MDSLPFPLPNLHLHILMLHLHLPYLRLLHAAPDMCNDGGDVTMVLHHLLMVAAALIRGAGLDPKTHEDVDLEETTIAVAALEEPAVCLQEAHIGCVLIDVPQREIEVTVQIHT